MNDVGGLVMRKMIALCIAGFLMGTAAARGGVRLLEIHGGYWDPKGIASGFIFGGNYGIAVDERVDISLGLSYFYRNYRKDTEVAGEDYQSGVNETTVMTELEYNTTLIPITANATIRFPFGRPLYWFAGGSVAYQFLFNTENNYQEDIKERRFYRGFGWMVRGGIEYAIGSRSSIILEAFYNRCKVKGNKDKVDGLPVWNEVDVSGLGFRAGLKLEFF